MSVVPLHVDLDRAACHGDGGLLRRGFSSLCRRRRKTKNEIERCRDGGMERWRDGEVERETEVA